MTLPRRRRRPRQSQRPDRRSDMLRRAAIAVVVVGTLVSALGARTWQETIVRQHDERLDRSAASPTATIENVMANYENALQAARSLWVASDSVSRREFNAFARSLDLRERYPGLQGIGWRSYVTDTQRAAFVARARADREPGFTIRPAGRRPVYYVTLYSYPRIPSSSTLGADARAVPSVLATLDQARDSGQTTVSNQTTLPGDLDLPARERPVAFELFVPVYRRELTPEASVAERRRTFVLRFAPLPGDPTLTDRTVPARWCCSSGSPSASGSRPCCGCWPRSEPCTGRWGGWPGPTASPGCRTGGPGRGAAAGAGQAARSGQPVYVALLDVDHCKAYNDRHGHQAGDRFLKEAAAAWQAVVRKTDLVTRYGGEDTTALIARADRALYAAKEAGRNRVRADAATAVETAAP